MTRPFRIRVPGQPTADPTLDADTIYALTPSGWNAVALGATAGISQIVIAGGKADLRRIDAAESSISRVAVALRSTSPADTDSLYNSLTAFRARGLDQNRSIVLSGDVSGTLTTDLTSNATVALSLPNISTAGTFSQVVTDAKGRVVSGTFSAILPLAGGTLSGNLTVNADTTIQSLNSGPLAGFRNHAMNGCFRINARNASSVTAPDAYPCDRFRTNASGGSRTAQRITITDADRTAIGVGDAMFALQNAVTGGTAATNFEMITHGIEGVRTLSGRAVTLSFWARRTSGSGNLATEMVQIPGSGGTPSANVTAIAVQSYSLTTSWQRFTRSVSIPAVSSVTLGTNDDDRLELNFWFSGGSSFNARNGTLGVQTLTAQLALVQLEVGSAATPFEGRPKAVEQQLCERFFQRRQMFFGGSSAGGAVSLAPVPSTTTLRAAPTVTIIPNGRTNIASASVPLSSVFGAYVEYVKSSQSATYTAFDFIELDSDY